MHLDLVFVCFLVMKILNVCIPVWFINKCLKTYYPCIEKKMLLLAFSISSTCS